MKALAAALVLLASQLAQADKIDDIVVAEMKRTNTPGVAIAIMKDGKPIKIKGYGYANLEHKVPVKPETVFQSGSVGKQFTSTLVMMLVEEGKIGLEDPVSKYITESAGKWDKVTVRHLLTHTSGLPDMPYHTMDLTKPYTEEDMVKLMIDQPIPKDPGVEWRYNNGGYVMLGVLVKRATGKFYGDLLAEKIFKPLGMGCRVISEADIVPNRAAGYEPNEMGELRNQGWVSPSLNTTADGALYMTALDMAKWDAALYTEKLLKKASLDQMWTPVKLNDGKEANFQEGGYGFGWSVSKVAGHSLIDHAGAWQGFNAYIGRLVDKKLTVVVLANRAGAPIGRISRLIFNAYVPDMPLPKPPPATPPSGG